MDRELVFKLRTTLDREQVSASLKELAEISRGLSVTVPIQLQMPDVASIVRQVQEAFAKSPLTVPVTLAAQGFAGGQGFPYPGGGFPAPGGPFPGYPGPMAPPGFGPVATALPSPAISLAQEAIQQQKIVEEQIRLGIGGFAMGGRGVPPAGANEQKHDSVASEQTVRRLSEANEQMDVLNRRMNFELRHGLYQTFQAVTQLGRGFAYIGAVGEEDMRKVLDTLMKVEATIHLIRGGIDVFRGISTAVNAYTTALERAAAIQGQLAASRAAETGISGSSRVVGIGTAGAAGAAGSQATGFLSGGIGYVPHVAAALAALVGGGLGIRSLWEYATGHETPLGAEREFARHPDDNRWGSWNPFMGEMHAQAGSWAFRHTMRPSTLQWWLGNAADLGYLNPEGSGPQHTIGAIGQMARSGYETERFQLGVNRQMAMQGRGRLSLAALMSARAGRLDLANLRDLDEDQILGNFMGTDARTTARDQFDWQMGLGQNRISEAVTRGDLYNIGAFGSGNFRDALEFQHRNEAFMRLQLTDRPVVVSQANAERADRIQSEMQRATSQRDLARQFMRESWGGPRGSQTVTDDQLLANQERLEAAERRLADLAKERLALEQDIRREKEAGLRESVAGLQQLVQAHREEATAAREQLSGQQERFGLMDEGQAYILRGAGQRVQQIQQAEARGDVATATALRRGMSREELELLRSTGDEDTMDFVRGEAHRRAGERGLGAMFSGRMRRRITDADQAAQSAQARLDVRQRELDDVAAASQELEGAAGRIEVQLRDNRRLEVNIERDDSDLVDEVVRGVREQLDIRDRAMLDAIESRLQRERSAISRLNDQDAAAAGFARRRG